MSRNIVRRKPRQYITEEERKDLNEVAEEERNVLNEFAPKAAAPPSPSPLREPARTYKNIMDTRDINVLNEPLQGPKSSPHGGGETDVQEYPPRTRMSDTTRLWEDCSYLPPFQTPHFRNSAGGVEECNFPNSAGEVGDFLSPLGKNFKNFPAQFEMHPVGSPRRSRRQHSSADEVADMFKYIQIQHAYVDI